jgi:glycosyltransferase involved in cell wall biosynthesis
MKQLLKKVSLIGTNGIPSKYGGFETLAEYLAKYWNEDFDLYCYCSATPKEKRLKYFHNTKLIHLPFKANGWQSIFYDAISIVNSLIYHDILIVLGFSGVIAFPLKFIFKKKIIFNIGGIEWQKVRGSKLSGKFEIFVKKGFEWICVKSSDTIIVDNQVLYDYVKEKYNIIPVLAEYGGDHAIKESVNVQLLEIFPFLNDCYDVSISRAQEDMNIHLIMDAYKSLPERKLVIISNWHTTSYGKSLKNENHDKYENIILLDAIYDLKILNTIRGNCSIYLHTHSLCGTAPSLVEAMSLGLPTICFDVPTNRATTEEKSYYFKDIDSLVRILRVINSKNTKDLGINMLEIASRRYNWERVVNIYKERIDIYEKN